MEDFFLNKDEVIEKVKPLAEEICEREGYILYDIEFHAPKKTLTVFIDKEKTGVNLEDCSNFSKGLNFLLDSEDPISTQYYLEVSSPGLERLLKEEWHFKAQLGKKVKVVLTAKTDSVKALGKKNFEGLLLKADEDNFYLLPNIDDEPNEENLISFPYKDVHKCNVVFEGKF